MDLPIPIIDLAGSNDKAASELLTACKEHGFFFVQNHGVPTTTTEELFRQSKIFFEQPENVKLRSEAIGNRGYTAVGEQTLDPSRQKRGDTKESYYICKPEAAEGSAEANLPFHAPNRWPAAIPGFKPAVENYIAHMATTQSRVVELMALALDLPADFLEKHFTNPIRTTRPIHYTAEQSNLENGIFGAGAHTDFGFLAFVETNCTPGLQVFYKDQWRPVPCLPNTLVVNIGDMLQRWTNGLFKSTLHRVMNETPGKERYSCASFISPNYDTLIECLPTCKGDGALFEPVLCHKYLESRYRATHAKFAHAAAA